MVYFSKFIQYVKNSKRFLYFIVFIFCMLVSMYQLIGCINKLQRPPVSTHYKFVINDTLNYPAVTICRNPPFKYDVLKSYGMEFKEEILTNQWKNFPFHNSSLEQFWDQATYTKNEIIKLYGLHGFPENAEIIFNYYYFNGRCFTFLPRIGSKFPWPNSGWSMLLRHDTPERYFMNKSKKTFFGLATDQSIDGYHVFIHEVREPYSENTIQTQYAIQYLYLEVGEEIEVRISADEFRGYSTWKRPCTFDNQYSQYQCVEHNQWMRISKTVGCTVPWMRGVDGLPHCNNYEQLKQLIQLYKEWESIDDSSCIRACNISSYKIFVVKRKEIAAPFSQLYVYYTSKLVTVMEELPGYDSNDFLADLGGSLGFFLGLSVIGLIGVIEKSLNIIFCYAKPILKENKELDLKESNDPEKCSKI